MASTKRSPKSTSNNQTVDDFYDREFASQLKPDQFKTGPGNSLKVKAEHLKSFKALTQNQQHFFDYYDRGDIFIGLFGSPGVGKTFLAMYRAFAEVLDKSNPYKQVVIIRSSCQTRNLGFLPGNLTEKMEIFEGPYIDNCATLFGRPDAWERLKEQGHAKFISTTAIRGISIDDSIIIVDEAANYTLHELSSVISRVSGRSKIIFVGDIRQNDLIVSKYDVSGLMDFIRIAETMEEFSQVKFTPNDIVRSGLCRSWVVASEKLGF